MSMGPVPGGPGMQPQVMGQQPGTPQPQPGMGSYMPAQTQDKLDNITKVKALISQLRDSLMMTLKTAAQTLHQNSQVDSGTSKDVPLPRFDKTLEEFNSICDQIELNLKTSIECLNQSGRSQRYLSLGVVPIRNEPAATDINALTYPQYLATVRGQVAFAKEVHDLLMNAAHNIVPQE